MKNTSSSKIVRILISKMDSNIIYFIFYIIKIKDYFNGSLNNNYPLQMSGLPIILFKI